ncbi:hypothetical protein C0995_009233 [Termitomyces sp. Mi166|nr:hypothetical protein C0995_009233 [Termitomyces sp. Mi166\
MVAYKYWFSTAGLLIQTQTSSHSVSLAELHYSHSTMPRTASSPSDDETVYCSGTESVTTMAGSENRWGDFHEDTELKAHIASYEKEYNQSSDCDYDDWVLYERIPARKVKGTKLGDVDNDNWQMRKKPRHEGFIPPLKKRGRARSFREKYSSLVVSQEKESDSDCHADDESSDVPPRRPSRAEERELVTMHLDGSFRDSNDFRALVSNGLLQLEPSTKDARPRVGQDQSSRVTILEHTYQLQQTAAISQG